MDGFLEAYGEPRVPESFRETVKTVLRQRLSAHEHPEAVADALREVPRSRPFESWDELERLDLPVTVVASRDEADPEHPYAIGERYAEAIPGARLRVRGAGQVAARLAGRPALTRDRRDGERSSDDRRSRNPVPYPAAVGSSTASAARAGRRSSFGRAPPACAAARPAPSCPRA